MSDIEKKIHTKALDVGMVVFQDNEQPIGELEFISQLRTAGKITQPAANVDVYAPGVEAIVDEARTFFQAHRGVSCVLEVIAE